MWQSASKKNIAIVKRFFDEHWNGGSTAAMDTLIGTDHKHHFSDGEILDREGLKKMIANLNTAFPDIQTFIDDIFATDDKVVVRFTIRGTHQGEGMGIPPTGKRVSYTGIDIFRLASGKIVERWGEIDTYGVLRQLGALQEAG